MKTLLSMAAILVSSAVLADDTTIHYNPNAGTYHYTDQQGNSGTIYSRQDDSGNTQILGTDQNGNTITGTITGR